METLHERILLGTAGTIVANAHLFANKTLLVAHADNLVSFDLQNFQKFHYDSVKKFGIEISMIVFETSNPESCGIVELNHDGLVIDFHEKISNPPGNLANGAIYIFEPSVIDFILKLEKPCPDLSLDVIPSYMGRIAAYKNINYLRDIGTPNSLCQANQDVTETPEIFNVAGKQEY